MDIDTASLELIYPCIRKSSVEHVLILSMGESKSWGFYNAKTGFILDPVPATYYAIGEKHCIVYKTVPYEPYNTVKLYLEESNELLQFQGHRLECSEHKLETCDCIHISDEDENMLYSTKTGKEVYRGQLKDKKISSINSPIVVAFRGNNNVVYGISRYGDFGQVEGLLSSGYIKVEPFKRGSHTRYRLYTKDNEEIIVNEYGQYFGI